VSRGPVEGELAEPLAGDGFEARVRAASALALGGGTGINPLRGQRSPGDAAFAGEPQTHVGVNVHRKFLGFAGRSGAVWRNEQIETAPSVSLHGFSDGFAWRMVKSESTGFYPTRWRPARPDAKAALNPPPLRAHASGFICFHFR